MSQKKLKEEFEMGKALGRIEAEDKMEEGRGLALVPKELQSFNTGNLPYSRDRIIEELKFFFQHEVAAKFEIGKRLFLLKEMEGIRHGNNQHRKGVRLADILGEHFPCLSKQRAYEYILFAQKATKKFKEWAEGGKNWKKALALLDTFDEKELKALEDGEPVQGMLFDEIDAMTVTELKDKLRGERKKNERGKEQLEKMEEEVKHRERFNPDENVFILQMEGARLTFDQLLKRIDPESEKVREFFRDEDENGREKKHKPTIKMRACYLEVLGYMKKMTTAFAGMSEDMYGTAEMLPENVYNPAMAREAAEALSRGKK